MNIEKFRVPEGQKLDLSAHPTNFTADYIGKKQAVKDLRDNIKKLKEMQSVLYAEDVRSFLIIFQAMDAAGKDGAIKHVMSGLNPQGTQVFSFKQPSKEELDHGYLWRCMKAFPERGRIGIFNRSYYEDVLVVRVHPQILQSQQLPESIKNDPDIWKKRFVQISNLEKYLSENGTHVIKFFLNVSKEEQKKRFLARIDTPEKNWKFSSGDVKERGYWDDYMLAYAETLENTSTANSPWYIIPADKKWFTRLAVSEGILKTMESLGMKYPEITDEHMQSLIDAKKLLESET